MKKKLRGLFLAVFGILVLTVCVPELPANPLGYCNVQAASVPTVNKKKVTLKWGKTATLKVKNATKKVKWKSSNKKVCQVVSTKGSKKQNAVIRAMKKGSATITAKVGTKNLKVKVKVNHTHSYTYPATCTAPAHCVCGKTYGTALGHQMSAATCKTPATCVRCGVTSGSTVGHSYSNNHCIWCGILNLSNMLDLTPQRTSAGGFYNMRFVGVTVRNKGTSSFVVPGGTTRAYVYPNDVSAPVTLYLTDEYDNALRSTTIYPGNGSSTIWFDTLDDNSKFTFMPTGRLEFNAQYGERSYKIILYIDGSFTFSQIG